MNVELRHKIAQRADIYLVELIEMLDNSRGKGDLLDEHQAILFIQIVELANVFLLNSHAETGVSLFIAAETLMPEGMTFNRADLLRIDQLYGWGNLGHVHDSAGPACRAVKR
jgi:hypothetical protein